VRYSAREFVHLGPHSKAPVCLRIDMAATKSEGNGTDKTSALITVQTFLWPVRHMAR